MSDLRPIDTSDVTAKAEVALARATGSSVRMQAAQLLSNESRHNVILRARADGEGGRSRSVIVKATRSPNYDPASDHALETSGLIKEWVATALIGSLAPDSAHGARLLAGDIENGILIFDDLGDGLRSLADPLLHGTAADAEHALKLFAEALGRLHADTAGCLDAHLDAYQSIFGAGHTLPPPGWRVEDDVAVVRGFLEGAPPADELELLTSRLQAPGPWLALTHGDPCPDNALIVDGRIRLIDYEFARPAHALLDGISWQFGFPTCWCAGRIPGDVAARIDAAYRAELGKSIPEALDDGIYRTELVYAAAIWLFRRLAWRLDEAVEDDVQWGIWSIRGRLLWDLEAVVSMTDAANMLPGINATARRWLSELRRRWPDATPLGYYPAFRQPSV